MNRNVTIGAAIYIIYIKMTGKQAREEVLNLLQRKPSSMSVEDTGEFCEEKKKQKIRSRTHLSHEGRTLDNNYAISNCNTKIFWSIICLLRIIPRYFSEFE